MTENINELVTTESTSVKEEGSSNHSHSHHSHSHHHHSHHKHSHRNHSSRRKRSGGSFSIMGFLQKSSNNRTYKNVPQYRVISQRILFCVIMLCFVYGAVAGILSEDEDPAITTAQTTRSETDQLKSQINMLQLEKIALEAELDRYKSIYGELDE